MPLHLLIGPRRCGKSVLIQKLYPNTQERTHLPHKYSPLELFVICQTPEQEIDQYQGYKGDKHAILVQVDTLEIDYSNLIEKLKKADFKVEIMTKNIPIFPTIYIDIFKYENEADKEDLHQIIAYRRESGKTCILKYQVENISFLITDVKHFISTLTEKLPDEGITINIDHSHYERVYNELSEIYKDNLNIRVSEHNSLFEMTAFEFYFNLL